MLSAAAVRANRTRVISMNSVRRVKKRRAGAPGETPASRKKSTARMTGKSRSSTLFTLFTLFTLLAYLNYTTPSLIYAAAPHRTLRRVPGDQSGTCIGFCRDAPLPHITCVHMYSTRLNLHPLSIPPQDVVDAIRERQENALSRANWIENATRDATRRRRELNAPANARGQRHTRCTWQRW